MPGFPKRLKRLLNEGFTMADIVVFDEWDKIDRELLNSKEYKEFIKEHKIIVFSSPADKDSYFYKLFKEHKKI